MLVGIPLYWDLMLAHFAVNADCWSVAPALGEVLAELLEELPQALTASTMTAIPDARKISGRAGFILKRFIEDFSSWAVRAGLRICPYIR
jgi:hypothetical protein